MTSTKEVILQVRKACCTRLDPMYVTKAGISPDPTKALKTELSRAHKFGRAHQAKSFILSFHSGTVADNMTKVVDLQAAIKIFEKKIEMTQNNHGGLHA